MFANVSILRWKCVAHTPDTWYGLSLKKESWIQATLLASQFSMLYFYSFFVCVCFFAVPMLLLLNESERFGRNAVSKISNYNIKAVTKSVDDHQIKIYSETWITTFNTFGWTGCVRGQLMRLKIHEVYKCQLYRSVARHWFTHKITYNVQITNMENLNKTLNRNVRKIHMFCCCYCEGVIFNKSFVLHRKYDRIQNNNNKIHQFFCLIFSRMFVFY